MGNNQEKTGIVLMNTGTPASPEPKHIKPYLAEFLADPRLVSMPRCIWLPILNTFVVNSRPQKTAKRYQTVWTKEGSPFQIVSQLQAQKTQAFLQSCGCNVPVRFAARYGQPSLESEVFNLEQAGCTAIHVIPLFPQSAFCTTLSCKDKVFEVAKKFPQLHFSTHESYPTHPLYTEAVAASIKEHWNYTPGSKLLFSFHAIPLRDVRKGDTYVQEIHESVTAITQLAGIPEADWAVSFHSRFEDSRRWLGPNPKKYLELWAAQGITRVAMITPGFAADCLESLLDCAIEQRDYFLEMCSAYKNRAEFTYIPALNTRNDHIELLGALAKTALSNNE
jgi:ferrochelatase